MQQNHEIRCQSCKLADDLNKQTDEKMIDLFLICTDGHTLCPSCHNKYAQIQHQLQTCIFHHKQNEMGEGRNEPLKVEIPIKAYKIQGLSVVTHEADKYLKLSNQSQKINAQIKQIQKEIQQMPQPPNQQIFQNYQQLQQQIRILKKEHRKLKQQVKIRRFCCYLIIDLLIFFTAMTSTGLQSYYLINSAFFDYCQIATIVAYFVVFYLTVIFANCKSIFECKSLSEFPPNFCQTGSWKIITLIPIICYYIGQFADIFRKRFFKYFKKRAFVSISHNLTFQKGCYIVYIAKIGIFLQYLIRLLTIVDSTLNFIILGFSIAQVVVLVVCQIINYCQFQKK